MRECVACNRVKKCAGVRRCEVAHLKSSRCANEPVRPRALREASKSQATPERCGSESRGAWGWRRTSLSSGVTRTDPSGK